MNKSIFLCALFAISIVLLSCSEMVDCSQGKNCDNSACAEEHICQALTIQCDNSINDEELRNQCRERFAKKYRSHEGCKDEPVDELSYSGCNHGYECDSCYCLASISMCEDVFKTCGARTAYDEYGKYQECVDGFMKEYKKTNCLSAGAGTPPPCETGKYCEYCYCSNKDICVELKNECGNDIDFESETYNTCWKKVTSRYNKECVDKDSCSKEECRDSEICKENTCLKVPSGGEGPDCGSGYFCKYCMCQDEPICVALKTDCGDDIDSTSECWGEAIEKYCAADKDHCIDNACNRRDVCN